MAKDYLYVVMLGIETWTKPLNIGVCREVNRTASFLRSEDIWP